MYLCIGMYRLAATTPTATGRDLLPPVLGESMNLLDQRRHHSFDGYIQQTLQMLHSLLVGEP